jgi:AcrR family transcriptional regulator
VVENSPAKKRGELAPRERVLATAAHLFYAEGIRSVGVDRIVAEAGVTLATFYRHFASKEHLVLAYVDLNDQRARTVFASLDARSSGAREQLALHIYDNADQLRPRRYRGCPFVNAASEYPDPASGVHQAILTHRRWYLAALAGLCEAANIADPQRIANMMLMLRDGAGMAGYLGNRHVARRDYIAAAQSLLGLQNDSAAI